MQDRAPRAARRSRPRSASRARSAPDRSGRRRGGRGGRGGRAETRRAAARLRGNGCGTASEYAAPPPKGAARSSSEARSSASIARTQSPRAWMRANSCWRAKSSNGRVEHARSGARPRPPGCGRASRRRPPGSRRRSRRSESMQAADPAPRPARRWSRRAGSQERLQPRDQIGRRVVLRIAGDHGPPAEARHQLALGDRAPACSRSPSRAGRGARRRAARRAVGLGEEHHPIDAAERVDELGALALGDDGPAARLSRRALKDRCSRPRSALRLAPRRFAASRYRRWPTWSRSKAPFATATSAPRLRASSRNACASARVQITCAPGRRRAAAPAASGCATSARFSSRRSSAAETGTVPGFCTLSAPATLAMRIACTGSRPPPSRRWSAAITVSPAPVTSTASAEPCAGDHGRRRSGRSSAIPLRPRVTSRASARHRLEQLAARILQRRGSPPTDRPTACSSSTSFGLATVTPR